MADPFEVRVRFSAQLQNLNASVTSAQKAAAYALKYKDMDEDLHSCIIEQLEKPQTALNTRANIMYFLEHFLELAQRAGHNDYVGMLQRDIIRVVDAVAPESGQGAANVKVVRRVLQSLQHKGFLERQAVTEIEEVLKERETDLLSSPNGRHRPGAPGAPGFPLDGAAAAAAAAASAADVMDIDSHPPSQTIPTARGTGRSAAAGRADGSSGGDADHHGPRRLDKKQIEERIEEDRERHKRLRENIWAVPPGADAEMWKLWEETSDLGEDDHLQGAEEQAERAETLRMSCVHREADEAAAAAAVATPATTAAANGQAVH
ncbi:sporulation protein [Niveomyces insectorum RCEF 264]|uniref:Sporulation protein n=1 Tax=Niveomyces insectorum RCEF 264 TaxID=1081102 RepID=A0A167N2T5_9HYPO|nr:sporulation protein [Niveomyces insectorum RCEF 264]